MTMERPKRNGGSRYLQVAVDIATRIAEHQYQVGEKLYTRSLLASQYAVSAETARRAVAVLCDLGIAEAVKGSGVIILSYEKAVDFVQRNRNILTLSELRGRAQQQGKLLMEECLHLQETLSELVDRTDRLKTLNPFTPYESQVPEGCPCIGKSLSALNFWHLTTATVIAIRRGEALLLSPGPYEAFCANDIVYYIGEESCRERVCAILEKGTDSACAAVELTL